VAMTENVLPFTFWALANANAANTWPREGGERLTGGSPRFQIYESKDGKLVAVAALEQKFWLAFTQAIELDAELIDDRADPAGTIARVKEIIASRSGAEWKPIFDEADCCCSIVQDLRAALSDPHFTERGIFARMLANERGDTIPALPLPLANSLQKHEAETLSAPQPGANNIEFGF
jgi:alpha-methylacyl-CoA racemase